MAYYTQPMEGEQLAPIDKTQRVKNGLLMCIVLLVGCILLLVYQNTGTIDRCNAYWRGEIIDHGYATITPIENFNSQFNYNLVNLSVNGENIKWK